MSIPALLNVALLSARKGAAEIEFAVKKVHTLDVKKKGPADYTTCLLYTSPSPRDATLSRMPSSA